MELTAEEAAGLAAALLPDDELAVPADAVAAPPAWAEDDESGDGAMAVPVWAEQALRARLAAQAGVEAEGIGRRSSVP